MTNKDIELIAKNKTLAQVFLEKNNIDKIEALEPLRDLPNLIRLELTDNPVTSAADYRKKVLDMYTPTHFRLTSLQYLDSKDRDGNDIPEPEEEEDEDDEEESEEDSAYEEDDFDSEEEKVKKRKTK